MAKFYGKVGYADQVETEPGIWEEQYTERIYTGDVKKLYRKTQSSNSVNDNVTVSTEISIMSDPFAEENFYKIRYVEYLGAKWKVENADPQYPRFNLTLGGLFNNGN